MMMPQSYNCWWNTIDPLTGKITKGAVESCTTTNICALRKEDGFNYEIDKTSRNYLYNWYVELDLMCESPIKLGLVGSAYFIGFSVGVVLF